MNAWLGIVGAIVGGGIAFIISRLQLREQRIRERNKLILSRLEEIHEVLSQFMEAYKASILERISTIQDADAQQRANEGMSKVPIEKLQMLIGFYAPELLPYLQKVEQAKKDYGSAFIKSVGLEDRDEIAQKETIGVLFAEEGKVRRACIEMQAEVIKLSKKYL
jgi:hypothetical protein